MFILFFYFRMRLLLSAALAVSAASVVLGQRPARIGPDGKPLLNRPVMEECQKSEWKYYENFFGRTWLWSSKQSLNLCQNSVPSNMASSDISKEYFEFEDCQANDSLVCIMWIESQLYAIDVLLRAAALKVNSVQEACAKFEILQIT